MMGCEDIVSSPPPDSDYEPILYLSMPLPITEDGYHIFDYPNGRPHTYTRVDYISSPMERVFWSSPDTFVVYHMYHYFTYPIINYSTYTSDDSTGRQLIYIYQNHIGDTLSVQGCISNGSSNYCKSISFIVTE